MGYLFPLQGDNFTLVGRLKASSQSLGPRGGGDAAPLPADPSPAAPNGAGEGSRIAGSSFSAEQPKEGSA
jgi:hypothetical protein